MQISNMKQLRSSVLRIQYASNLHVYKRPLAENQKLLNPVAPNLALLGDIGQADCKRTTDFLRWCADTYEQVYWVPGYTELANEKRAWFYQLDAIQEIIYKNNIKNIVFGNKRDIHLTSPSVQICMATLMYPERPFNGIKTYCQKEGISSLTAEEVSNCLSGEMDWLLSRTARSTTPVVWLTYCSPFRTITPYNSGAILNHPKLLASLVGYHQLPISMSGKLPGHPWVGINMNGYYNYNDDAFWEYDESRGTPGGALGAIVKKLELSIREQLYQPNHVPSPVVIMS